MERLKNFFKKGVWKVIVLSATSLLMIFFIILSFVIVKMSPFTVDSIVNVRTNRNCLIEGVLKKFDEDGEQTLQIINQQVNSTQSWSFASFNFDGEGKDSFCIVFNITNKEYIDFAIRFTAPEDSEYIDIVYNEWVGNLTNDEIIYSEIEKNTMSVHEFAKRIVTSENTYSVKITFSIKDPAISFDSVPLNFIITVLPK